MDIRPGEWSGGPTQRLKPLLETSPRRFDGPSSACHIWFAKEPATRKIHGLLPLLDPNLTLTRTQYPAIPGSRGNNRSLTYAEFAIPCNVQQPMTAHP